MRHWIRHLTISLLLSPSLFAQNTSLEGEVIDGSDKSAMIGVGILLSNEQDSIQTIGTATDLDGKFRMLIPRGKYRLKITYLGYKNKIVPIEIVEGAKDLGIISLEQEAIALKDV